MDGMVWWAEAGIDVETADAGRVALAPKTDAAASVVPAPTYRRTAEAWLSRVRERTAARSGAR